ncbi:uncharacterized protein LOC101858476 [Aplysia californica]|uniref:Uncharacterized protein LOC101858476 n=1 Tax=Aplysia californica TaxID=6500 RepID=A0ABM0JIQ2_APLCA|nr:uncharacterized protein LOC101858476 [Aplysia californica]
MNPNLLLDTRNIPLELRVFPVLPKARPSRQQQELYIEFVDVVANVAEPLKHEHFIGASTDKCPLCGVMPGKIIVFVLTPLIDLEDYFATYNVMMNPLVAQIFFEKLLQGLIDNNVWEVKSVLDEGRELLEPRQCAMIFSTVLTRGHITTRLLLDYGLKRKFPGLEMGLQAIIFFTILGTEKSKRSKELIINLLHEYDILRQSDKEELSHTLQRFQHIMIPNYPQEEVMETCQKALDTLSQPKSLLSMSLRVVAEKLGPMPGRRKKVKDLRLPRNIETNLLWADIARLNPMDVDSGEPLYVEDDLDMEDIEQIREARNRVPGAANSKPELDYVMIDESDHDSDYSDYSDDAVEDIDIAH